MKRVMIALIRFYQQHISGLKRNPTCRFYPTCSGYALTAVEEYGAIVGGFLSLKRILSCHPYGKQGVDPVPIRHRRKSIDMTYSQTPHRGYEILSLIKETKNRN